MTLLQPRHTLFMCSFRNTKSYIVEQVICFIFQMLVVRLLLKKIKQMKIKLHVLTNNQNTNSGDYRRLAYVSACVCVWRSNKNVCIKKERLTKTFTIIRMTQNH